MSNAKPMAAITQISHCVRVRPPVGFIRRIVTERSIQVQAGIHKKQTEAKFFTGGQAEDRQRSDNHIWTHMNANGPNPSRVFSASVVQLLQLGLPSVCPPVKRFGLRPSPVKSGI